MSEVDFDPFAGGELLRVSPTTWPQQEIIAAAKMSEEASTAFNEAIVLDINGKLDIELLKTCLNKIVTRHDILSATFSPNGKEICLQEPQPLDIEYEDLRSLSAEQASQRIQSLEKNIAISPMNLEEGPLLFAWLKQLDDKAWKLILATHHVICDGWSFGILLNELMQLYANNGSDDDLPATSSFLDFAEQQSASQVTNKDTDYWLQEFQQVPPPLDLPLDFTRPPARGFRAARYDYRLDTQLVTQLPKAASALKSSLVNYVMAAYFTLLYRLTGNNDIVVGLPVAGQATHNRPDMFGHAVQLLPIRLQLDNSTRFNDLVGMVKKAVLDASEHSNFTFGKLLETIPVDRSRVPLINTIFNIDQAMTNLQFGDAKASLKSVPRAAESFELFLNIVPSADELLIEATYSSLLFNEKTVLSWMQALENILATAIQSNETKLDDFCLLKFVPDALKEMNQTETNFQFNDFLSAFNAIVTNTPDAIALIAGEKSLSYSKLEQDAEKLAAQLSQQGVNKDSVIAICCDRSEKLLISSIAIFKLGAAYLPLDPDFPEERLLYMLEDSGAFAIIEDESAPEKVKASSLVHFNIDDLPKEKPPVMNVPPLSLAGEQLAYIIYTSGSTGKPKGVRISQQAMLNFLQSMANKPGFDARDKLLAVTTLSFDISVLELFLPLLAGGTTLIASRDDVKSGDKLAKLLQQHEVSVMQATPSTWRMLLASDWKNDTQSKKIKALCGGEPLTNDLKQKLLPKVAELWNMYGPTETTVWSSCQRMDFGETLISIGSPIANTQIYILDTNLNPLPTSIPGELCIGGKGLSVGYHNRPELNQDRFFEHSQLGRLYRTGDAAKVLPTGELQHLGRMDDQIKLRGYRIELGEIETALSACPSVDQAAVYLWQLSEEDVRLVACCVPKSGTALETIHIRKQLRISLPNYMVPQYFLAVDELPLSPNGKVNRRKLPRPEVNQTSTSGEDLSTDNEKTIANIWSEVLKSNVNITRGDNFFELGGHSLLAIEAIRRIESTTGARLQVSDIIVDSLSTLAEKVARANTGNTQQEGPQLLERNAVRQLSAEQRRLLNRQILEPTASANNLPAAWVLEGELDTEVFKRCILRVFERQTALRTIVSHNEMATTGNESYQLSLQHINDVSLPEYFDFSKEANALDIALADVSEKSQLAFDMIEHLLCRVMLYKIGDNKHLLAIVPHQLIFDGWSFDIFLGELEAYYTSAKAGHAASLEPLALQYRDFADWSSKRAINHDVLNYHERASQGIQDKPLPFDPNAAKAACKRLSFELNKLSLNKLEAFCATHNLRIHEVIFAALCQAHSQWLKNEVCKVGIPVTGRYIPEAISLIGSFVSILPAEFNVIETNFIAIAKNIASQLKTFYEHQDLSFAELTQNTNAEKQAFSSSIPISFAFQDIRNRATALADLHMSQIDIDRHQTEYPIECWSRIQNDSVLLVFDYDTGQVDKKALQVLADNIQLTLESLDKVEDTSINEANLGKETKPKVSAWRRLFQ